MKRILVTGATGNIGLEVVHYLRAFHSEAEILLAVRDTENAKLRFENIGQLKFREFDFENESSFPKAFDQVDILFLLRPPHITNLEKVFRPLLKAARKSGINKVVFLSVQGAERSSFIPHHKIEKLIQELDFEYIFVRPSYFMQNLTTSLLAEIHKAQRITLPAGKAKFNWVDVKNIGEASATLMVHFDKYKNGAYEITGKENKNFKEVISLMTKIIGKPYQFKSVNPIYFYFKKKREGLQSGFALVMTILHFLPRLQAEPVISENYQKLTGKAPTTLQEFIERERGILGFPKREG